MKTSRAYEVASLYLGEKEVAGRLSNPKILKMLQLDASWVEDDATPWCSAFVNWVAYLCGLPRSKSLAARSWLNVGVPSSLPYAKFGDVVILTRGRGPQPGPEVLQAPGHVGFFAGREMGVIRLLGGNQGDQVSFASFPVGTLLGVRSLE